MDKAQKQLIDTYFLKRDIASEQSELYWYVEYEVIYFITNKIDFDDTKITGDIIANIIIIHPDLIGYFDLKKLSGNNIGNILEFHPILIRYLKKIIDSHNEY